MITAESVAQSLHQAVLSGVASDAAVSGMVASLKHRGSLGLLPRIVSAYERILLSQTRGAAVLAIAKIEDEPTQRILAAKALNVPESEIAVVIDETIIGGSILKKGDLRIDSSHKRALLSLYTSITHTDA